MILCTIIYPMPSLPTVYKPKDNEKTEKEKPLSTLHKMSNSHSPMYQFCSLSCIL